MMPTTRDTPMDTSLHAPPTDTQGTHGTPRALDNPDWHAWVDGHLPPAQADALHQQLQGDESALDTIAHWTTQRTRLQALHADLLNAPVPEALLASALRVVGHKEKQTQWWRWGGMAASVLVAFVLGWTGRSQWVSQTPGNHLSGTPAHSDTRLAAAPAQRFAQQAAVAHAVYQPEVRHPVEVAAAQQEHLVQWLSKRLGRQLKLPVLAADGYELVGGRLLPGDTGARAQFMYQNSQGERITLYLGGLTPTEGAVTTAVPPGNKDDKSDKGHKPASPGATHSAAEATTAFQFNQEGPVPSFYWTDAGFGYALSGQLSRTQLLSLATTVYHQLQP